MRTSIARVAAFLAVALCDRFVRAIGERHDQASSAALLSVEGTLLPRKLAF